MNKNSPVNKALSGYYNDIGPSLAGAGKMGNFGGWCYYDEDLFCQEREGCENCMASRKIE